VTADEPTSKVEAERALRELKSALSEHGIVLPSLEVRPSRARPGEWMVDLGRAVAREIHLLAEALRPAS
jgi:hypothetical protein